MHIILNRKQILIVITILLFLTMLAMSLLDRNLQNDVTPYGMLSFEFSKTLSNAEKALSAWGNIGKTSAAISLGLDYLFIVLYVILGFFWLQITAERLSLTHKNLSKFLSWLSLAMPFAGILDTAENFGLIALLLGIQIEHWAQLAFWCALAKFIMIAICLLALILGLLSLRNSKS